MVIVRDIDYYSLCEHHLLPFFGKCHVAYIPNGRVIGLSKIPRLVNVFARRLQLQERMTAQIAETIQEKIAPLGVAVVCEGTHLCMSMRGVEKQNSTAVTSAMLGSFPTYARTRMEFLALLKRQGSPIGQDPHFDHACCSTNRLHQVATLCAALTVGVCLSAPPLYGQTRRPAPRRPAAPAAPVTKTEPAMLTCPQMLGEGVRTKRQFCDVLIGRDPAGGILVTLPPHTGTVTLTLDLHNRHTYSEELVRTGKAYRRYTATVGVLTLDNTLISRAIIQNEFRAEADLVDRISGGSGASGLKAVAPTGTEPVSIVIPAEAMQVSILGEKLSVVRPDNPPDNFSAIGRPMAIISNVMVEYRPPPPPRPVRRPPARRPAARKN